MEIEKNISLFIQQQFPGIYREDGPELVQLVKDYYKFLETQENQSVYVSRRMFEYKDVDTTLSDMIMFFKKKFLADLPLKESTIRFIVKNILDLYRRKGTPAGIELFFAIFYQEFNVEIYYPSKQMLKVSNSQWRRGVYLQLFPNNNVFLSKTDKQYSYKDLISKNIKGSVSDARAAVSRINFIILNGIKTPILYIDSVQGTFEKYDDVITNINGEVVSFGKVNGSLNAIQIEGRGTSGNKVGNVYDVVSEYGSGGKVIVSKVSDAVKGEIEYTIEDGGYGYTIENTRLLVSDKTILLTDDQNTFTPYEYLEDTAGNRGRVIGYDGAVVGVLMDPGDDFSTSRAISTVDRFNEFGGDINITLSVETMADKNGSSPGTLFPDGGDSDTNVIVDELTNTTTADLITDLIAPHLSTVLNIADYEANAPFSGIASPVNLSTPLDEAFDIQTLTIGRIKRFRNINPGSQYVNDVFARAEDSVFRPFGMKNQILMFSDPGVAGVFNLNEIIQEQNTGIEAIVKEVNTKKGYINVIPFDYYGFSGENNILRQNSDVVEIVSVQIDYNGDTLGDNAIISSTTEFAIGEVSEVVINNSGFAYVDGSSADLVDSDGTVRASGTITARTQGVTAGYWASFSSHLNGFVEKTPTADDEILPTSAFALQVLKVVVSLSTTPINLETWLNTTASDGFAYGDLDQDGSVTVGDSLAFAKLAVDQTQVEEDERNRWHDIIAPSLKQQAFFESNKELWEYVKPYDYFESGQRIQDSDFFQEYSYQIKSTISKDQYEKLLRENVHLAGTKMFGDFLYKAKLNGTTKARFIRFFNDEGKGSPLDVADINTLEASVTNFTVDSDIVTADHEPV
jgi:hypothetical protein